MSHIYGRVRKISHCITGRQHNAAAARKCVRPITDHARDVAADLPTPGSDLLRVAVPANRIDRTDKRKLEIARCLSKAQRRIRAE